MLGVEGVAARQLARCRELADPRLVRRTPYAVRRAVGVAVGPDPGA
ncbi:hypothetical protein ACFT38_39130 [Streptomyces sp. NPDC056975]